MMDNRGILILGHPRSGTTLLRRLLGAHPRIAAPPETHLFSACARFIQSDVSAHDLDMGVLAGLHYAGFAESAVLEDLRGFAFRYLDEIARREGKQRWAEKTAFDIFHLKNIQKMLQDEVFYLGIIRHPLDMAVSAKEFCDSAGMYPIDMHFYVQRYSHPIEAFVHSWIDTTRDLLDLGERMAGNCQIVRYEDLVEAPEDVLGVVLEALGEDFHEGLVGKALGTTGMLGLSDHKAYEHAQIHAKGLNQWRSLPAPQIRRLGELVNPLLEICGYELIDTRLPAGEDGRDRYVKGLLARSRLGKGDD